MLYEGGYRGVVAPSSSPSPPSPPPHPRFISDAVNRLLHQTSSTKHRHPTTPAMPPHPHTPILSPGLMADVSNTGGVACPARFQARMS